MMRDSIFIAFACWVLLAPFVFRHVPRDSRKSLSEHIASKGLTVWAGRAAICVTAIVILIWYFEWYRTLQVHTIQTTLIIVICGAAILLALIPYYKNTLSGKVHSFFAWSYALLLLPLTFTFAQTSETVTAKILISLLLLWQVFSFGLFLFYEPSRRHFLYYQLSYISAFGLVLLVANYMGH